MPLLFISLAALAVIAPLYSDYRKERKKQRKAAEREQRRTPHRSSSPQIKQPDPVKLAAERAKIAALVVRSDKLTAQISKAERRGNGLAPALIAQQEAINAEIETRKRAIEKENNNK